MILKPIAYSFGYHGNCNTWQLFTCLQIVGLMFFRSKAFKYDKIVGLARRRILKELRGSMGALVQLRSCLAIELAGFRVVDVAEPINQAGTCSRTRSSRRRSVRPK